jgi:hypothetical protein
MSVRVSNSEEGRANTYIEPSVKTTLRMIFCLNSRVSLHTIGIGKARIIKSAVVVSLAFASCRREVLRNLLMMFITPLPI